MIEHVGGDSFTAAVRACAKGGRIVTCGATAGHEPALSLRHVFWRQLSVLGSTMAPKGALHRILQLVGERKLQGVVDRVMPLDGGRRGAPPARGPPGGRKARAAADLTRIARRAVPAAGFRP